MTALHLEERARTSISLGESHFREFKSAHEGAPSSKTARSPKAVRRDIGEALVAFANADGGELLIGVEDDGRITGIPHTEDVIATFVDAAMTHVHVETPLPGHTVRRLELDDKAVLLFSVEKSTRAVHLTSDGRCLQRKDRETIPVPAERILFERQEQRSREYDRGFMDGVGVDQLNPDTVDRVGGEIAPGLSPEKLLQLIGLADFSDAGVRLRRAALLLFATEMERWHPRSQVRVLRVTGNELRSGREYNVTSDETVSGSIFDLMERSWDVLRPHLVQTRFGSAGVFEERIMYPDDACREALTNAIAHRDYSIEGRGIEIYVFDDRLEVRSPGALLSNISVADLKSLRGVHESRNAFVARVLREVGYMREVGEGLRRIYSLMKAHDLVEPELAAESDTFVVTLHHRSVFSEDAQRWLDGYERANLTRDEQKVCLLGWNDAAFSAQQVWDTLDIVDTEDYRAMIERLQLKGVLISALDRRQTYSQARRSGNSRKAVPRYRLRSPEDFDLQFSDLLRAFQQAGADPNRAINGQAIRNAKAFLSSSSPFATTSSLERTLALLGLIDPDAKPLGRLRAVLDTGQNTQSVDPKRAEDASTSARREPAMTRAEEEEFAVEATPVLYLGNVPYTAQPTDVISLFAPFGRVVGVRLPRDLATGRRRGFAFVEYENADEAKEARSKLNGTTFLGRQLYIEWGRTSSLSRRDAQH